MSDFFERMAPSAAFEKVLLERLNSIGWTAHPFGQGQLPDDCRRRLQRFEDGSRRPSLLRWMPDIITFRDVGPRSFVALIDAKVCGTATSNYAIEMSSVESAEVYTDRMYTPTFFVFDDWSVLTPREARQRGTPGRHSDNGSGTPYLLVSKRYGRPFESIFPAVRAAA